MRRPGATTATAVLRERQRTPDGQAWARDSRGNAVYLDRLVDVTGCSLQPGGSDEDFGTDGSRDQVTSTWTLYAPLSFPAGVIDAVRVHGRQFEVIGSPQRWEHPRLGHVVVTLREVSG